MSLNELSLTAKVGLTEEMSLLELIEKLCGFIEKEEEDPGEVRVKSRLLSENGT